MASLAGWHYPKTERGITLASTEIRTALLLTVWDSVAVKAAPESGDATIYTINLSGPHGSSIGSAVPVTRDGYFLTAAHCVTDPRQLTLVALTRDLRMAKSSARVVWTSGLKIGGADLALLHAPLNLARPFALADPATLRPGEPVALAGWSKLSFKKSSGQAAGRIVAVSRRHRGAAGFAWRTVDHNAPFNSGDSGGPLITPDGSLAGINAQVISSPAAILRMLTGHNGRMDQPLPGYTARAFAPEPGWLRRTIAADRAAHGLPTPPHKK